MRGAGRRRGFSLLEVMIAAAILAIGSAAAFAMLERVEGANRALDLTRTANHAYSQLAAQIRDAQCDYDGSQFPGAFDPTTTDPGLEAAVGRGWIGVDQPIPGGSAITHAGITDGANPRVPATSPVVRIEYRVDREAAAVASPGGGGRAPPANPGPAYDIHIRVRLLTGDPVRDDPALDQGWWIKNYPVKKVCDARYERRGRGIYQ